MSNYVPSLSSDEVFIGTDMSVFLTPTLETMNSTIAGKAPSDHTHTGYAADTHTHTEYAASNHEHTGYATADHTHDGYAASTHTHAASEIADLPSFVDAYSKTESDAKYALSGHTHTGYASSSHTHTASDIGAATADHTHSGYASSNHTHSGYASSSHTHSEYAAASHSHSNYASSSHNHDGDYLHATGDVNIDGVLRVGNQQAFHYASSTASQTIGTNNATGGTTIGCGASANTTINGANVKTKNAIPQASNTYYLGSTTFRWKGIYSNTAVNVASDERLKRDIHPVSSAILARFIDNLNVVSFNYKTDEANDDARIGLIAQAVQNADPEIAKFFVKEDEAGMLGLTPADLVFPLIATVQELKREIEELKNK